MWQLLKNSGRVLLTIHSFFMESSQGYIWNHFWRNIYSNKKLLKFYRKKNTLSLFLKKVPLRAYLIKTHLSLSHKKTFLRLSSSLFKAYFMPLNAFGAYWALSGLPRPFSASLGPLKTFLEQNSLFSIKTTFAFL